MKKVKRICCLLFSGILCLFWVFGVSACGPIEELHTHIVESYSVNGLSYFASINDVRFFDQFRYDDIQLDINKDNSVEFKFFNEVLTGKYVYKWPKFCSNSKVKEYIKLDNGEIIKLNIGNSVTGRLIAQYKDYKISFLSSVDDEKQLREIEKVTNNQYSLQRLLKRQTEILDECIQNKNIVAENEEAYYQKVVDLDYPLTSGRDKNKFRYRTGTLYNENGETYFMFDGAWAEEKNKITSTNYPVYYNYVNGEISLCQDIGAALGKCIVQYRYYDLYFDECTALYFY